MDQEPLIFEYGVVHIPDPPPHPCDRATAHLFVHAMRTPPDSFIGRQSEEVQVADFSKENKKWPKNEVSGSGAPLIVKPEVRVRVGMGQGMGSLIAL